MDAWRPCETPGALAEAGVAQGGAAGLAAYGMEPVTGRLGERREYGAYAKTLGSAVHYDAHLLLLYADDTSFRFDGLGSSWLVQMGHGQSSYPRDSQCDEMDARTQRRPAELRRLMDAIEHLRTYDPHLHHVVFAVCMAGGASITPGRGTRHSGEIWGRVVRDVYGGDDAKLWAHLQAAWQVIAVLAVPGDVLRAAQEAGATDERAVAWARERGLVKDG